MHLVWRIENQNGEGPYRCTNVYQHQWVMTHHTEDYGRPSPMKDGELWYFWKTHPKAHEFLFGFESIEQLKKWFWDYSELCKLRELGFRIALRPTDTVFYGKEQCIFLPTKEETLSVDILEVI